MMHEKLVPGSSMVDVVIMRVSLILDIIGHAGFILAKSGSVMVISGAVSALGGMTSPTVRSSLTKHVPHDQIGQMLGAVGLLHGISRVVAPTIFTVLYSWTVGKYTQAVFVCCMAVYCIVLLLSFFVRPYGKFFP